MKRFVITVALLLALNASQRLSVPIFAHTSVEASPSASAALSIQQSYIATYAATAVREMYRSGVPASITLAQGLLESGAGQSSLAVKGKNHFGIKCHNWAGSKMYWDDDAPNECFRAYSDADESFRDHSDFLRYSDRYKSLFDLKVTDYKGWAYGLKKAGYATDPDYASKLIRYVEDYQLYKFDSMGVAEAEEWAAGHGGKASGGDEVKASAPTGGAASEVTEEKGRKKSHRERLSEQRAARAAKKQAAKEERAARRAKAGDDAVKLEGGGELSGGDGEAASQRGRRASDDGRGEASGTTAGAASSTRGRRMAGTEAAGTVGGASSTRGRRDAIDSGAQDGQADAATQRGRRGSGRDGGPEPVEEVIPPSPLSLEAPEPLSGEAREEFNFPLSRELYSENGVPFLYAREGETYASIASDYSLFLKEILSYNDLDESRDLLPGEVVYIQPKKAQAQKGLDKYIVDEDSGSLRNICQRFGVKLRSVLKMNNFTDEYVPRPGDTILLRPDRESEKAMVRPQKGIEHD